MFLHYSYCIVQYAIGFFLELMLTCWFGLVWGEIVYQPCERGWDGYPDRPYVVHVSPEAVPTQSSPDRTANASFRLASPEFTS